MLLMRDLLELKRKPGKIIESGLRARGKRRIDTIYCSRKNAAKMEKDAPLLSPFGKEILPIRSFDRSGAWFGAGYIKSNQKHYD